MVRGFLSQDGQERIMTISELIKQLQDMLIVHGDYEVFTEGCDCYGDVARVSFDPKRLDYTIERKEEYPYRW